jgi:ribosomal-protein-alanine N-acetyltransferase
MQTKQVMLANVFPLYGYKVEICLFESHDITVEYINWLNDPDVTKFSNQRFIEHNLESCIKYFNTFINSNNLFLSVRRRDNGQAIGTMTVYFAHHHGTADVGILIGDRTIWSMGYGQDAWCTLIDWLSCQQETRKVTAGTIASNKGMINIIERCGMQLEAIRKKQEIFEDQPVDVLYYAKWHVS